LALERYCLTALATATPPTEPLPFSVTQKAAATRPLALERFFSTQQAPVTRPLAQGRSIATPPPVAEQDSSLNTAVGLDALGSNTTGYLNTAVGAGTNDGPARPAALGSNTTGQGNTAVGYNALGDNTNGLGNTAVGAGISDRGALGSNTTGNDNTAIGRAALANNTGGTQNIAVGNASGSNLTTGDNNIDIGNEGVADEANTIRIGTTATQNYFQDRIFIAGIYGATASGGVAVFVNADGQLGTMSSSKRFKQEIKPMDNASEAILALKPVTFHYKSDTKDTPQFGLIAEEVAKVNPNLVVRDKDGQIYTVRYDAVNAMLLNEFLKEHSTVQELKKEVAALTAGLQKVSAQLEASKPALKVVNNP
jgi:hypothetical protein